MNPSIRSHTSRSGSFSRVVFAALLAFPFSVTPGNAETLRISPTDDLGRALSDAPSGTVLELEPGDHHLRPFPFTEPTCGNCEEPNTPVSATVGALINGRNIHIRSTAGPDSTFIHTHAGYGLLFDGCRDCVLEGVTVTGGTRDPDPNATNAAIAVKHGRVRISDCRIRDNIGDPKLVGSIVVGIIGLAGREGAEIRVEDTWIVRSSWDGIALYRGASAEIENCVIDGVDRARGKTVGGGRGVGIGVTWDARVVARGNLVRNYWKGIGLFVDAEGTLEHNIVEDVLTWGISLWDAGKGRPTGRIRGNVVNRTGACGVAVVRESDEGEPGELVGNVLMMTGQDEKYDSGEPYCFQTAVARHAVPAGFRIADNLFFTNREPGHTAGHQDLDESAFREAVTPLARVLVGYTALYGSDFLIRYGN